MEVLGTVVRLQVQRSRLKPGPAGQRAYDPTPLLQVPALEVGERGVVGQSPDGPVLDVHHADHPDSRNRGLANGLSLLPRAHYAVLRERYGGHLVDGAAGESVLLETTGPWSELAGRLALETAAGGLLALEDPLPAPPCVEFSRFCLGRTEVGPAGREDDELVATLEHLDGGMRGFYVRPQGVGRLEIGSRLLRLG